MKRGHRVEIFAGRDGRYRYRLVGANGEKMTASEPYANKANAKRGARTAHPGVTLVEV